MSMKKFHIAVRDNSDYEVGYEEIVIVEEANNDEDAYEQACQKYGENNIDAIW